MRPWDRWRGPAFVLGLAAAACLVRSSFAAQTDPSRKVIIVVFGGGTRYSESIGDPNHRYIPHLWTDIVPKGVLFTNMRVEHKVVHPNSTGSMVTGHWEWDDLDWTRPVAPTVLEYLDLGAASGMVSSILNRVR